MNDFEYDDDKSAANQEKHGIDFLVAQALWNDPDLLEIRAKASVPCHRSYRPKTLVCCRHLQKRKNSAHFCEAFPQKRGRAV